MTEIKTKLQIFTASYKAFKPSMGIPVRTSNGRPKYSLPYLLEWKAPVVFPAWALVRSTLSMAEFGIQYRKNLDKLGVEKVREQLEEIAFHAGDNRLVLLCFEKGVSDCHRGAFATWWEEKTGEQVKEIR